MSGIIIGQMGRHIETPSLTAAGWIDQGNTVTVFGNMWSFDDVDKGRAIRQQLLGLADPPNPPHYLISEDDPDRNGYYRVLSMSVTSEGLWRKEGQLSWTATLERPLNYSGMRPQVRVGGAARAGKPAPITARHWCALPSSYGWTLETGTPAIDGRALIDGGAVTVVSGTALTPRNLLRMVGDPANHFEGAAVTSMNGYPVVGRQTVRASDTWMMSNGIVTLTPGVSPTAIFAMQVYDASGGGVAAPTVTYELELGRDVTGTWVPSNDKTITSVQVLRDSVEEQVVRISGIIDLIGTATDRNSFTIDISLRRGALGVDVGVTFAVPDRYGIGWVTPIAGGYDEISADNTGMRSVTADVDGMSPVLIWPYGFHDYDLTNGRAFMAFVDQTSATYFVGMSNELYASLDADDLQQAYYSTVRSTQTMVSP